MSSLIDPRTVEPGSLCAALFDVESGTGVCERFGPHEAHGGVLAVGVFRCHRCRHVIAPGADSRESACRCPEPSTPESAR